MKIAPARRNSAPTNDAQLRKKETAEGRHASILQAARAVFARQGFARTTIDDIAEAVGIGKGTVYLYFASKERIYLEALLENARELGEAGIRAIDSETTWRAQLRRFLETRLNYFEQNQDFFRIYATEFRNMCIQGKPLDVELRASSKGTEKKLIEAIVAAQKRGEVRQVDPQLAALAITDLTRGSIERRLTADCNVPGRSDLEFALDVLYRAFYAE